MDNKLKLLSSYSKQFKWEGTLMNEENNGLTDLEMAKYNYDCLEVRNRTITIYVKDLENKVSVFEISEKNWRQNWETVCDEIEKKDEKIKEQEEAIETLNEQLDIHPYGL